MANPSKVTLELNDLYNKQYVAQLNIERFLNDKPLYEFLTKINPDYSSKHRITNNGQIMKYTYMLNKTNLICTSFKITRDETTCIYGYLYSDCINGKVNHRYYCVGPTFNSQDGEYRRNFCEYSNIEKIRQNYEKVWDVVEQMVMDKMEEQEIELRVDLFYPFDFKHASLFEEEFMASRLVIKMFIMCWLSDFYRIHNKVIENHIHVGYQYIVYDQDDINVYNEVLKILENDLNWLNLIMHIHCDFGFKNNYFDLFKKPLMVGQKLFAITNKELFNRDDIDSPIWREQYISVKCSNFIANYISPSFNLFNDWTLIYNSHAGLYDNPAQYIKYEYSDTGKRIINELESSDDETYEIHEELHTKKSKSRKFKTLSNRLNSDIKFTEMEIVVANAALMMHTEFVGKTFRDIPAFLENADLYKAYIHIFADFEFFRKYIFEIIYGLFCMNTKILTMHGDLHLNNVTMHIFKNFEHPPDPTLITYIVGDGSKQSKYSAYVFPHRGWFATIIDYSRSILGDIPCIEAEYGKQYAEDYLVSQKFRTLKLINDCFGDAVNMDKLSRLYDDNFPLLFKIITIIDLHRLSRGFKSMLAVEKHVQKHPSVIDFIDKLVSETETMFLESIKCVLDKPTASPKTIEWPNAIILKKYYEENIFSNYKFPPKYIATDMFSNTFDVKYDLQNYDKYPPSMKVEPIVAVFDKHKIPADPGYYEFLKFVKISEENELNKLIKKNESKYEEPDEREYF
jgi:hypothetical protein